MSAWDTGALGKLAVLGALLLGATAVAIVMNLQEQVPFPLATAALALGAFVFLMAILKFIDVHSYTSFGLWLTVIASAVATYGGYELEGHTALRAVASHLATPVAAAAAATTTPPEEGAG